MRPGDLLHRDGGCSILSYSAGTLRGRRRGRDGGAHSAIFILQQAHAQLEGRGVSGGGDGHEAPEQLALGVTAAPTGLVTPLRKSSDVTQEPMNLAACIMWLPLSCGFP